MFENSEVDLKMPDENLFQRHPGQDWAAARRVGFICTFIGQVQLTILPFAIAASNKILYELCTTPESLMFLLWSLSLVFTFFMLPLGYLCAWFSHYWFASSTISTRLMTAILAMLVEVTIIGWVIILVYRNRHF